MDWLALLPRRQAEKLINFYYVSTSKNRPRRRTCSAMSCQAFVLRRCLFFSLPTFSSCDRLVGLLPKSSRAHIEYRQDRDIAIRRNHQPRKVRVFRQVQGCYQSALFISSLVFCSRDEITRETTGDHTEYVPSVRVAVADPVVVVIVADFFVLSWLNSIACADAVDTKTSIKCSPTATCCCCCTFSLFPLNC